MGQWVMECLDIHLGLVVLQCSLYQKVRSHKSQVVIFKASICFLFLDKYSEWLMLSVQHNIHTHSDFPKNAC